GPGQRQAEVADAAEQVQHPLARPDVKPVQSLIDHLLVDAGVDLGEVAGGKMESQLLVIQPIGRLSAVAAEAMQYCLAAGLKVAGQPMATGQLQQAMLVRLAQRLQMTHDQTGMQPAHQLDMAETAATLHQLQLLGEIGQHLCELGDQYRATADLHQLAAGTLAIANLQPAAARILAHRQPGALAVAVLGPGECRHPAFGLQTGKVFQLLTQRLLLELQLGGLGDMLETATATQGNVRAGGFLPLGTGGAQLLETRLDQLAARTYHPRDHLFAGQPALDEHGAPLPAADTAAVMGKTLQGKLDALACRCRSISRPSGSTPPPIHARPSNT